MRKLFKHKTTIAKENTESNILYESNIFKIISYDNWEIIDEKDCVICVPIFIESNKVAFRSEYIPTFKYKDKKETFLSPIMGIIEDNETPEQALKRELEEEAGIVLRENVKINFETPLFISKGNASKAHICFLYLSSVHYDMVQVVGDGSITEEKSSTFVINKNMINSLISSDILTSYIIERLKTL